MLVSSRQGRDVYGSQNQVVLRGLTRSGTASALRPRPVMAEGAANPPEADRKAQAPFKGYPAEMRFDRRVDGVDLPLPRPQLMH